MKYTDNYRKFVCVLNRNADRGVLQNASLHAMAGLIAKLDRADKMNETEMLEYLPQGDLPCVLLSTFPVIVLSSKSSHHLNTLRARAETTQGIYCNYFTSSMNCSSAEEQLICTRSTPIEHQEFLAIVLFGNAESIDPLTKKFSIYKND